jgi:hypothetical protein
MLVRPHRPRPTTLDKGLLVGQKKPLEPKHVWSIRVRLEIAQSWRDLVIFNLAIDSKLRACDLVRLRLDDICAGAKTERLPGPSPNWRTNTACWRDHRKDRRGFPVKWSNRRPIEPIGSPACQRSQTAEPPSNKCDVVVSWPTLHLLLKD